MKATVIRDGDSVATIEATPDYSYEYLGGADAVEDLLEQTASLSDYKGGKNAADQDVSGDDDVAEADGETKFRRAVASLRNVGFFVSVDDE